MTVIKPVRMQDIILKEKIQEACKKANLNFSEVLAINEKFGTNIKYTPVKDIVEISVAANKKRLKKADSFADECFNSAIELCHKANKVLLECGIKTKKDTFTYNIESALEKLKKVL